jgi:hypothetical protein
MDRVRRRAVVAANIFLHLTEGPSHTGLAGAAIGLVGDKPLASALV